MFEKDFLNRIKFSRTSARQESEESGKVVSDQDDPGPTCPPSVSTREMAQIGQQNKTLRKEQQKGGWRASARWLEENCEEFREAKAVPRSEQAPHPEGVSSRPESTSAEIRAGAAQTLELQGPCIAPGCPQSSVEALSALPPISPLESAFWQGLLYGSPDALISGPDATRALYLLSDKLGIGIVQGNSIETLRAGALRKFLQDRFGCEKAELAMSELWHRAPVTDGFSVSNDDQSHCSPGVLECPRSMPDWRRDFHQEVSDEQRLLEGIGGWCG